MKAIIFDFAGVILDLTTRRPVAGVTEFIQQAHTKGYALGVASSSLSRSIEQFLTDYQLRQYFSTIIGMEDVEHTKPDPECFQLAAEQLGVPISDCVVIDDTEATVQAARQAQFTVVWFGQDVKLFSEIQL